MRQRWPAWLVLLVAPAAFANAPQVSVRPASLVLGNDEKVSVAVRVEKPGLRLRTAGNAGVFEGPDDASALEQHFSWTPPSIRFPMTVVLLFWVEERGSAPELAMVRIALIGRTTLQINTEPGAQVRVQVADATFGPRRADKRGRVEVPIEVPPGVKTAHVVAEARGRLNTRAVSLDVPPANPLALAISPDPLIRGERAWLIAARSDSIDVKQLKVEVMDARAEIESAAADRALFRISPKDGARQVNASVSVIGEPIARATASAPIVSAPAEGSSGAALAARHSFAAGGSAGGFYAGGANTGLALALDASYSLPALGQRLALELELGFRSSSFTGSAAGLGTISSTVSALLIEVALRGLVAERGAWTLHGRVGGGAVPFHVSAHSDFQAPFGQSGLALEGFVAGQVGYRVRSVELFGEVRGALAPARTSTVDAQLGGLLLAIGARYELR